MSPVTTKKRRGVKRTRASLYRCADTSVVEEQFVLGKRFPDVLRKCLFELYQYSSTRYHGGDPKHDATALLTLLAQERSSCKLRLGIAHAHGCRRHRSASSFSRTTKSPSRPTSTAPRVGKCHKKGASQRSFKSFCVELDAEIGGMLSASRLESSDIVPFRLDCCSCSSPDIESLEEEDSTNFSSVDSDAILKDLLSRRRKPKQAPSPSPPPPSATEPPPDASSSVVVQVEPCGCATPSFCQACVDESQYWLVMAMQCMFEASIGVHDVVRFALTPDAQGDVVVDASSLVVFVSRYFHGFHRCPYVVATLCINLESIFGRHNTARLLFLDFCRGRMEVGDGSGSIYRLRNGVYRSGSSSSSSSSSSTASCSSVDMSVQQYHDLVRLVTVDTMSREVGTAELPPRSEDGTESPGFVFEDRYHAAKERALIMTDEAPWMARLTRVQLRTDIHETFFRHQEQYRDLVRRREKKVARQLARKLASAAAENGSTGRWKEDESGPSSSSSSTRTTTSHASSSSSSSSSLPSSSFSSSSSSTSALVPSYLSQIHQSVEHAVSSYQDLWAIGSGSGSSSGSGSGGGGSGADPSPSAILSAQIVPLLKRIGGVIALLLFLSWVLSRLRSARRRSRLFHGTSPPRLGSLQQQHQQGGGGVARELWASFVSLFTGSFSSSLPSRARY